MSCSDPSIPSYLHSQNKKCYSFDNFKNYQKYYRLKAKGNPIEIPNAWINALSGKWSKLIQKRHICKIDPDKPEWNDYNFLFINDLHRYSRETQDTEGNKHHLSCVMNHSPKECDYSHCEILIKHKIIDQNGELTFDETYTYEDWAKKKAKLKKSTNKTLKALKKDYRLDMIRLINRSSYKNNPFHDIIYINKPKVHPQQTPFIGSGLI